MIVTSLHLYNRQCTRKAYYSTRKLAKRIAKKWNKKSGNHYAIYECPHCANYHIATYNEKLHHPDNKHLSKNIFGGRVVYTTNESELNIQKEVECTE